MQCRYANALCFILGCRPSRLAFLDIDPEGFGKCDVFYGRPPTHGHLACLPTPISASPPAGGLGKVLRWKCTNMFSEGSFDGYLVELGHQWSCMLACLRTICKIRFRHLEPTTTKESLRFLPQVCNVLTAPLRFFEMSLQRPSTIWSQMSFVVGI